MAVACFLGHRPLPRSGGKCLSSGSPEGRRFEKLGLGRGEEWAASINGVGAVNLAKICSGAAASKVSRCGGTGGLSWAVWGCDEALPLVQK
jgi:hypothetical protein